MIFPYCVEHLHRLLFVKSYAMEIMILIGQWSAPMDQITQIIQCSFDIERTWVEIGGWENLTRANIDMLMLFGMSNLPGIRQGNDEVLYIANMFA